jgi:hypothetical protein
MDANRQNIRRHYAIGGVDQFIERHSGITTRQ